MSFCFLHFLDTFTIRKRLALHRLKDKIGYDSDIFDRIPISKWMFFTFKFWIFQTKRCCNLKFFQQDSTWYSWWAKLYKAYGLVSKLVLKWVILRLLKIKSSRKIFSKVRLSAKDAESGRWRRIFLPRTKHTCLYRFWKFHKTLRWSIFFPVK